MMEKCTIGANVSKITLCSVERLESFCKGNRENADGANCHFEMGISWKLITSNREVKVERINETTNVFFIDIATMCDMQRIAHRVSVTNDHTLNSRMKGNLPVRLGAAVRGAILLSTVTIVVDLPF
jgi:hypothetical protein